MQGECSRSRQRSRALNTAFIQVLQPEEMTSKDSLPRISDALPGCTIHLPKKNKRHSTYIFLGNTAEEGTTSLFRHERLI